MKELRSISKLIDSFQRLPGIGHKTAEKMAYQVLEMKDSNVEYKIQRIISTRKR